MHNLDNQVKPKHFGPLESLVGTTCDTFLIAMAQLTDTSNNENKAEKPKLVLKFNKPIETLNLGYKEISTFDTENAKEFG